MATIIGSARHDENGKYVNGSAGDQLQGSTPDYSGEVSLQDFYVHSKGWYILRPKSASNADKIAEEMYDACNNKHIGYDQNGRYGIITYGIHTTTNTECDCSSLVRECVKEATGKDPGDFDTSGEASALEATGLFEAKKAYTSGTTLYTGDVLVTKTKGHTVIVVKGVGRTSDSSSGSGTSSGTGSGTTSGTTGSTSSSKLSVDGQIGKKTVTKLQQVMGQTGSNVDGFIDGQPSGQKKYWTSILSEACKWTGGTSAVVKKLQQYVKDAGYSPGTVDGKLGSKTAKAVQKYLIAKGFSCGSSGADGYFGTNSAKGLQNWLNTK